MRKKIGNCKKMIFSIFLLRKSRLEIGNSIESAVNRKSSDFGTHSICTYISICLQLLKSQLYSIYSSVTLITYSSIYVYYALQSVVSSMNLRVEIIGRISSTAAIQLSFNLVITLAIAHFNSRLPFFLNIQFARNVNLVSSLIRLTDLLAPVFVHYENER